MFKKLKVKSAEEIIKNYEKEILPLYQKAYFCLNKKSRNKFDNEIITNFIDTFNSFIEQQVRNFFVDKDENKIQKIKDFLIKHIDPDFAKKINNNFSLYANLEQAFFKIGLYQLIDLQQIKKKYFTKHLKYNSWGIFPQMFQCVEENTIFWANLDLQTKFPSSLLWNLFFCFTSIGQINNAILVHNHIAQKATHKPPLSLDIIKKIAPAFHHLEGEYIWKIFLRTYPKFFKMRLIEKTRKGNSYYTQAFSYAEFLYIENVPLWLCKILAENGSFYNQIGKGWGNRPLFLANYLPQAKFENFIEFVQKFPEAAIEKNSFENYLINFIADKHILKWYQNKLPIQTFYMDKKGYNPIGQIMALALFRKNFDLLELCLKLCQEQQWDLSNIKYKTNRMDLLLDKYLQDRNENKNLLEKAIFNHSIKNVKKNLDAKEINNLNQDNLPIWTSILRKNTQWYYQKSKTQIFELIAPYIDWNTQFKNQRRYNNLSYLINKKNFVMPIESYIKTLEHFNWSKTTGFLKNDFYVLLKTSANFNNFTYSYPDMNKQKMENILYNIFNNIFSKINPRAKKIFENQIVECYKNYQQASIPFILSYCEHIDLKTLENFSQKLMQSQPKTFFPRETIEQLKLFLEPFLLKKMCENKSVIKKNVL